MLHITSYRNASKAEWESYWRISTYATYFQSLEWAMLWQNYTAGKLIPNAYLIDFSDGVTVVLPASYEKTLLGKKNYLLSSAGTYGGWLGQNLSEEHAALLVDFITHRLEDFNSVYWRLSPLVDVPINKIFQDDKTHLLPLDKGFDELLKGWSSAHARAAGKAQKEGITVALAESPSHWKAYYELYKQSQQRWGDTTSNSYDYKLFELFQQMQSPNVKLWLAFHEETVVAGALCLYAGAHISYWHGAANATYFSKRPVNYLFYHILEEACRKGYHWFDFNPSGNHEGVKQFKKGFGAVAFPSPIVYIRKPLAGIYNRLHKIIS